MSKITASVATIQAELPTGVSSGLLRFNLLNNVSDVIATFDQAETTVVFANIADGSYQVQVCRLDTNSVKIGEFYVTSDPFDVKTVVVVPTFYDAPSALTITVSAD